MENKNYRIITIILIICAISLCFMGIQVNSSNTELIKQNEELKNNLIQQNELMKQMQQQMEDLNKRVIQHEDKLDEFELQIAAKFRKRYSYYPQNLSHSSNSEAGDGWTATVTAYDLSIQSCGKSMEHPSYGVTASGFNLAGHSLESARAIAVDPNVIPLGSQVELIFQDEYASQFNGVYTAVDTGGDIGGSRIDLFMGDFQQDEPAEEALIFGVREAIVRPL